MIINNHFSGIYVSYWRIYLCYCEYLSFTWITTVVTLYVLHAAYTQSVRARKVIPTPNLPVLSLLYHSACSNSRPHTNTNPGHVDLHLSNSSPPVIVCWVVVVVTLLASTAPAVPPPINESACCSALADHRRFFFASSLSLFIVFFCDLIANGKGQQTAYSYRYSLHASTRCCRLLSRCKSPNLLLFS
jgi:hypothetical protein